MIATLLLSQGVPMIPRGRRARPNSERQQQRVLPGQRAVRGSTGISRTTSATSSSSWRRWWRSGGGIAVFSRRRFLQGRELSDGNSRSRLLRRPRREMTDNEWHTTYNRLPRRVPRRHGDRARGQARASRCAITNFLVLFNAHHERIDFLLGGVS
jgi:hypothetical protein